MPTWIFATRPRRPQFRAELRAWIDANLPEERRGGRGGAQRFEEFGREWSRKLYDAGYAGLTWPKEYGGAGAPYSYQAIVLEEMAAAEAPPHIGVIGLGMAGPTIIVHGTDAQKEKHLSKILSAEDVWCQGFSEPGAGSDLAARAHARGAARATTSSSTARRSGRRSRTSPTGASSSRAATPTRSATQASPTCSSTCTRPASRCGRCARSPARPSSTRSSSPTSRCRVENVLGEIGGGWQVAMTTLLHERGTLGFALTAALDANVRRLIALAKERGVDDALQRDRDRARVDRAAGAPLHELPRADAADEDGHPGPGGLGREAALVGANQRLTKLALRAARPEAQRRDATTATGSYQQLRSRGNTIEAGTSEILRNIIAERVLGLPRSR